ncbi:Fe(2+) transporter permease subunit FeoB [Desulfogranum mediterraneum]|uniref:Fe(2+) transporter permease subunit FeoB n=1 Tax=Desulfogranum mediterraneum TaxID=160661 RepID=UPI0003FA4736|nr:Fe(2+) transporter permease subunit FeoB [Desulfogranum mediterraneum]
MKKVTIGVVGNPNCGKTTLFNALTGARQRVGNWPGVTVDRKTGVYEHAGRQIEVVDTPGIYSLSASSLDEEVTRDFVLSGDAQLIVNIVDASNIERNLYLTSQLMEMRVPLLIVLNMMDVAKENGLVLELEQLAAGLGCPVIPLVATKGQGMGQLKDALERAMPAGRLPAERELYPAEVAAAVDELVPLVRERAAIRKIDCHWLSARLLEDEEQVAELVGRGALERAAILRESLEERSDEELDITIASAHYGWINQLTSRAVRTKGRIRQTTSQKIDQLLLNRYLGIPLFLAAMYLMFMFTINLGGAFIDFFDLAAGAIFVDGLGTLLQSVHAPTWLVTLLAGGIGGGIQTMATFIPPIGFMFLFLSFLEDSGYMARAAFVMDRFMRLIGLPGKSFIPMLVGFGCNVPAIMATRTLENQRDRTLTIMMNPFISCGARLPVYALFAAAFFPSGGQNLVFLLYLIGIGAAVFTGLILKNTLLKGEITPFVMELPPYHLPSPGNVLLSTMDRLKSFIFKAGKILIPLIAVLTFLNSWSLDGTFGHEESGDSALASICTTITPIFAPMGIRAENWPATVGIFTGIFAKEAIVGTLDALYGAEGATGSDDSEDFALAAALKEALATIPANLAELSSTLLDPLGISMGSLDDHEAVAREMEVELTTFGSMVALFGTKAAAFAYLLFVLLYFPCSAAIAAVYRETNLRWTLFIGFWTTFLAYVAATLFYQLASFGAHPAASLLWIVIDLGAVAGVVMILALLGRHRELALPLEAAQRA